jgi:hypothetical protein
MPGRAGNRRTTTPAIPPPLPPPPTPRLSDCSILQSQQLLRTMALEEPAHEAAIGRKLWEHKQPHDTEMSRFKAHIAHKYNIKFSDNEANSENSLWRWSVDHIPEFWAEVWDRTGIRASRRFESVSYCGKKNRRPNLVFFFVFTTLPFSFFEIGD